MATPFRIQGINILMMLLLAADALLARLCASNPVDCLARLLIELAPGQLVIGFM